MSPRKEQSQDASEAQEDPVHEVHAWAMAPEGVTPSRRACESVLRHVWRGGGGDDAEEPQLRSARRAARAAPRPAADEVKQRLRAETDAELAREVFGVPTIGTDDRLFWGFDALDMAGAFMRGDPWFDEQHWQREGAQRPGIARAAEARANSDRLAVASGFHPRIS